LILDLGSEMAVGQVLASSKVFSTLNSYLEASETEVVLVAPFINIELLESLLDRINKAVKVTLVTRFRPEEIVKGLNSLRIYDLFLERRISELRLSFHLHAKYYRVDGRVVLGSGNLTHSGLNTFSGGNHEIMIELDSDFPGIEDFETSILASSSVPTSDTISDLRMIVEELAKAVEPLAPKQSASKITSRFGVNWVPLCESPSSVFYVYEGMVQEIDKRIVADAIVDLSYLSIPADLDRKAFDAYIRIVIGQSSLMASFMKKLDDNGRVDPDEGMELISMHLAMKSKDAETVWHCAINWLQHFFPQKFQIRDG